MIQKNFMRFPRGKSKAVTLSFDDGVRADIRMAAKLKELHLCATFNLNSGFWNGDRTDQSGEKLLSPEECKLYLTQPGFELAVHTRNHPHLTRITAEEVEKEILEDKQAIEELAEAPVRGMAYPYGLFDEQSKQVAKACGIVYSRTCKSHYDFGIPTDWLEWGPTCHYKEKDVPVIMEEFLTMSPKEDPALFYLWTHSYECTLNDHWDVFFGYLERLAHKEDIWYATNIGVYDYVEAYKRLQFTVDEAVVTNPSAISVWIETEGRITEIRPGETVRIREK